MSRLVLAFVTALCSLLMPALARAEVCIAVDATRDRLMPEEQEAARQVLENVVRAAGSAIGPPCGETWTVSHTRLGTSVQVLLVTPRGAFTGSATSLEALPAAYESLARRGLGLSDVTAPSTIERSAPEVPVANQPPAPEGDAGRRRGGQGIFYTRVGYGSSPPTADELESRHGPTIGVGYRRAVDRWLFDLSVMNLHAWRRSSQFDSDYCLTFLSFGRLGAAWLMPRATDALYAGGAISFGESEVKVQSGSDVQIDNAYGVQLEGTLGWEILRNRAARVFFEAWAVLPLASTETTYYDGTNSHQGRFWAPFFGVSTGLGF